MDKYKLPHHGWYKGTVPVTHADGEPTIVELSCPLGVLRVYGLIDRPEHQERGRELCAGSLSRQRIRGIVPRRFTHVQIVPLRTSPGFAWWRLGFRPAGSLPELQGTVSGGHSDVLRYSGPPTTALLAVPKYSAILKHYPSAEGPPGGRTTGKPGTTLVNASAPYRGRIEIPGPGLIVVDSITSWTLTLPD